MHIRMLGLGLSLLLSVPALAAGDAEPWRQGECGRFTVAVIPDTQNYVDYRNQVSTGFPFDAVDLYHGQMRWIAENARGNGGDIVFATHVGDLWQHYSEWMDPAHEARGFKWMPNPAGSEVAHSPKPQTRDFEIPAVVEGFRLIAGKLPFSVVPGNHDYDALWTDPANPPRIDPRTGRLTAGIRHVGGLEGYRSAFSDQSEFFRDQPWYIGAHDGGADSAQVFQAGECRILHIGLQYHAPDASLAWAERILRRHPGWPTIVTTHDYLDRSGERNQRSNPDNSILDHRDNNPQMIWDAFISRHDQIFMVLSGHVSGQSYSVDRNLDGHEVHQVMADYQSRRQTAKDAGRERGGAVGDGWLRLMTFDLDSERPGVEVRTYSTHYRKFSSGMPRYASWYKAVDGHADTPDAEFLTRDEFDIELRDFDRRFGAGARD